MSCVRTHTWCDEALAVWKRSFLKEGAVSRAPLVPCAFQHCLPRLPGWKVWVAHSPCSHCAEPQYVFVWPGLLRTVETDHMPHQYFLGVPSGRLGALAVFLTSLPVCLQCLLRASLGDSGHSVPNGQQLSKTNNLQLSDCCRVVLSLFVFQGLKGCIQGRSPVRCCKPLPSAGAA